MTTQLTQALEALKIIRDQSNPYESNVCDQARIYRVASEAIAALSSPSSASGAPVMDEKGEREAFEAWARPRYTHPEDFDQRIKAAPGTFNNYHVQAAWEAWQARANRKADEIDLNRVLSLADVHAEESNEDGTRLLDRGGLFQFAKDVLRIFGEKQ